MKIDFDKGNGLVPVIVQDYITMKVLMLGYMNAEALEKTKNEGKVTFFSRTKDRLWTKGETSGNFLYVKGMMLDCDNDTILIKAQPAGPVCHTGDDTCFGEKNDSLCNFIPYLEKVIESRKNDITGKSYTKKLFDKGIPKISQKVGEEAVELVIEAMSNDDNLFLNEAADLMFHYLVLLNAKGYRINDVVKILKERHK